MRHHVLTLFPFPENTVEFGRQFLNTQPLFFRVQILGVFNSRIREARRHLREDLRFVPWKLPQRRSYPPPAQRDKVMKAFAAFTEILFSTNEPIVLTNASFLR
jgi:hypothetical protein